MEEDAMRQVGGWILDVLRAPEDEGVITRVREEIREFAGGFPVPGIA